jgi:hypothetical protein
MDGKTPIESVAPLYINKSQSAKDGLADDINDTISAKP